MGIPAPAIGPGAPRTQAAVAHGAGVAEAALMSGGISKSPTASKVRARMVMSSPTVSSAPRPTLILMVGHPQCLYIAIWLFRPVTGV
jgi:hypothetical protein